MPFFSTAFFAKILSRLKPMHLVLLVILGLLATVQLQRRKVTGLRVEVRHLETLNDAWQEAVKDRDALLTEQNERVEVLRRRGVRDSLEAAAALRAARSRMERSQGAVSRLEAMLSRQAIVSWQDLLENEKRPFTADSDSSRLWFN